MAEVLFFAGATALPLFVLWAMLFAVDAIAASRGLGGAHPLSMATALTLLLWSIMACAWAVFFIHQVETGAVADFLSVALSGDTL